MTAPNPFDKPAAPAGKPWPAPGPQAWTPVVAVAQFSGADIPPDPAIDLTDGTYIVGLDGEPLTRTALLALWEVSKQALETAKAAEMDLRKKVVAAYSDAERNKGTENIELANDYSLKVVKAISYKLVSKAPDKVSHFDAVRAAQAKLAAYVSDAVPAGMGALIANRLVKWSADLSVTEYNALPAELKPIIDEVVETADKAPVVSIVAPKDKK